MSAFEEVSNHCLSENSCIRRSLLTTYHVMFFFLYEWRTHWFSLNKEQGFNNSISSQSHIFVYLYIFGDIYRYFWRYLYIFLEILIYIFWRYLYIYLEILIYLFGDIDIYFWRNLYIFLEMFIYIFGYIYIYFWIYLYIFWRHIYIFQFFIIRNVTDQCWWVGHYHILVLWKQWLQTVWILAMCVCLFKCTYRKAHSSRKKVIYTCSRACGQGQMSSLFSQYSGDRSGSGGLQSAGTLNASSSWKYEETLYNEIEHGP